MGAGDGPRPRRLAVPVSKAESGGRACGCQNEACRIKRGMSRVALSRFHSPSDAKRARKTCVSCFCRPRWGGERTVSVSLLRPWRVKTPCRGRGPPWKIRWWPRRRRLVPFLPGLKPAPGRRARFFGCQSGAVAGSRWGGCGRGALCFAKPRRGFPRPFPESSEDDGPSFGRGGGALSPAPDLCSVCRRCHGDARWGVRSCLGLARLAEGLGDGSLARCCGGAAAPRGPPLPLLCVDVVPLPRP